MAHNAKRRDTTMEGASMHGKGRKLGGILVAVLVLR